MTVVVAGLSVAVATLGVQPATVRVRRRLRE